MREWRIPIPVEIMTSDAAPDFSKPTIQYEIAVPHLRDVSVRRGSVTAIFVNGNNCIGVEARWASPKPPHPYHWFVSYLWRAGEKEMTRRGL